LLFEVATPAKAQGPAYLHAISDLRSARVYLQWDSNNAPQRAAERQKAINEISKAIDEMKKAAFRDGKDVWQSPPPQSGGDPAAPFHTAVRLLREARSDVDHGYDLPENNGLRERSFKHINDALAHLEPFL
jgi:hypothetical protein